MEIQLPKNINSEEAVLNCINTLSSIIDDKIFITYYKKIKSLIAKTGDLKLQLYFRNSYEALILKREESTKKTPILVQLDSANNKEKSFFSFKTSYNEQKIKSKVVASPVISRINWSEISVLNELKKEVERLRNDNNDLQKILLTKDEELKKCQDNFQELNNQNTNLKTEKEKLEAKIHSFTNNQLVSNKSQINHLTRNEKKHSIPILRHERIMHLKECEIDLLNERLSRLEKEKKIREDELNRQIKKLKDELEKINNNNTNTDSLNGLCCMTMLVAF